MLNKVLPKHLDTFHLVNSGSEAVETALKVVQYVTKKKVLFLLSEVIMVAQ